MAVLELLSLDAATPQIRAPATGDTYSAPRAIALAPETLTGSAATSSLAITQTWNTTGTPTALSVAVTDTASNAASLLFDMTVGGVRRIAGTKGGRIKPVDYGAADDQDMLFYRGASVSGRIGATISSFSQAIGIGLGTGSASTPALRLEADAANTLALRNGVNAQAFRWAHTFTDLSNRQNGALKTASDQIIIEAETAGTGADNIDVTLTPAGTGNVRFGTHAAITAETVTGYITVKDAGGTLRKLAVVS